MIYIWAIYWLNSIINHKQFIMFLMVFTGRCWRVQSQFQIKLFDFDRSSKLATSENSIELMNTLLNNKICEREGQCNRINPYFDLFKVLWSIGATLSEFNFDVKTKYETWIRGIVMNTSLLTYENWAWGGQLCECRKRSPQHQCLQCTPIYPRANEMLTPIQTIFGANNIFAMYSYDYSNFEKQQNHFENVYHF